VWQALTHLLLPGRRSRQAGSSSSSRPSLLPGAQLYDVLCALLMLGAVVVLNHIKPGVLYYWMKDITSEFLKIQVLFTALEILDKVGCTAAIGWWEACSVSMSNSWSAPLQVPQAAHAVFSQYQCICMCCQ
jgi:hypothetical protein